jgi:hypothetical protein
MTLKIFLRALLKEFSEDLMKELEGYQVLTSLMLWIGQRWLK